MLKVVYGAGWGQKGQKRLQITIEGPHLYKLEGANNIKNVRNQKSLAYFFQWVMMTLVLPEGIERTIA